MEDFEDMRPEPVGPSKSSRMTVTVNMDNHRSAFRRKWPEPHKPYVMPSAIPPRVRMADAPEDKIPANAMKVVRLMREAGYDVRVTYGVSGSDRFLKARGDCPVCLENFSVKKDGNMGVHGPRAAPCEGVGREAIKVVPAGKPLPPLESIAVRIKKFGAACWVDGSYDVGGYIDWDAKPPRIMVCDWTPFWARVKKAWQEADGAGYALPLGVEPGK